MNTHDMLLRTILQHPADDTARLVYADWCDENGRGWRAELIRLQVGGCKRTELHEAVKRWERNAETISAMRHAFLPSKQWRWKFGEERGRFQKEHGTVVRRGFVDEVVTTVNMFCTCAADLFTCHPVARVRFTDLQWYIDPTSDGEYVCTWRRGCPVNLYPLLEADQETKATGPVDLDVKVWTSRARAEQSWSAACVTYGRHAAGLEG